MDLIEKDRVNYYKGKLRLCFQLNRYLMSNETNLEYSISIINKHIVPEEVIEPVVNI